MKRPTWNLFKRNLAGAIPFLAVTLTLWSPAAYGAGSTAELIARGDSFYQKRAEGHNGEWASTEPIEKALNTYLEAYEKGDRSPELAARILRASFFYATNAEKDRKNQKKILQRAIDIGSEVIEKHPDNVALNYQMAGCWGRWGEVNGIIASARKGVADKVKYYGERVLKLDPDYEEGGGHRTMGRLHFKAPYIPLILSWPDKKEALRHLARAVEAGPQNLTNHLFYAESLFKAGSYGDALKHVNVILSAKLHESKVVEDLRDKRAAGELKRKIEARVKKKAGGYDDE